MSLLASVTDKLNPVLFSAGSHFSLYSLAAGFLVGFGFLAWRRRERRGRVNLKALSRAFFSRKIIFNRSTKADVFYFCLNVFITGLFIGWFCLSTNQAADFTQGALVERFGFRPETGLPGWLLRGGMTAVGFLAFEFGYWFDHYLKHRIPFLWEMHKTHHTAQRLTPWTVWRVHPLDSLVFTNVVAVSVGLSCGLVSFALGEHVPAFSLGGANAFLVLFFFTFVHLQHSEVWFPLRGWAGRLLMSPAHHQIHHSIDPAHYNSNMGNALAVFDWLFGTLVMPQKESPRLAFGADEPGVDPHCVTELVVSPFRNAALALVPKVPAPEPPIATEKPVEIIR